MSAYNTLYMPLTFHFTGYAITAEHGCYSVFIDGLLYSADTLEECCALISAIGGRAPQHISQF